VELTVAEFVMLAQAGISVLIDLSFCAFVYHKSMAEDVCSVRWFPPAQE
jgi:hypothetical protein